MPNAFNKTSFLENFLSSAILLLLIMFLYFYNLTVGILDFIDSSSQSLWGRTFQRTFNQAMSMLKLGGTPEETERPENHDDTESSSNEPSSTSGMSLNAYLTYVSLPLTIIMQGKKNNLKIQNFKD